MMTNFVIAGHVSPRGNISFFVIEHTPVLNCKVVFFQVIFMTKTRKPRWFYAIYIKGPIFSKAIFKSRWLLEHDNLSKVNKYVGKFLNSISQILESIYFC